MMVGRIAARRHAFLASLAGITLVAQGPRHFSSPAWDGPKQILGWIGGDVFALRLWGALFLVLACILIGATQLRSQQLYRLVLSSLAFVWGTIGAGFIRAGFLPTSSFFVSILCFVAVMSIANTVLSLDPRTKDAP